MPVTARNILDRARAAANAAGFRYSPGIRTKLVAFLIPLIVLLVFTLYAAVAQIATHSVRRDLLQRGVSTARVVALSAAYSLLSEDWLAIDNLTAETRRTAPDIDYIAVRDIQNNVLAHSRIEERGKPYVPSVRVASLGTFSETQADDVVRDGREMIEFTTAILFAGRRVGTVSVGFSKKSLLEAQRNLRRSMLLAAIGVLALAFVGTLVLSSLIVTPVKELTRGVNDLAGGKGFRPIPVKWQDELGELTGNFNRMAETILAQQERLTHYAKELEEAYIGVVRVVAASIDARDTYTLGHSTRVARLSCELGRRIGLSGEELERLEKAALFHDVGKLSTPDNVLLSDRPLSVPEAEVMRRHASEGAGILAMAPFLRSYIPAVLSHHEWYDGTGYPDGKKGEEIPLHARIIALADAYDAMTTTRPYRQALTTREAIASLLEFRGTQFSPELTDAFVKLIAEMPPMEDIDWRGMAL